MKSIDISYSKFKSIVETKELLPQYSETLQTYNLFAIEGSISWETTLIKGTDSDTLDFETNKNKYNKPLEHRSIDGLPKFASSRFADVLSFWLDGTTGKIDVPAESIAYMKKHFDVAYTLSGVDIHWFDANWGDHVDFQVGIYTDPNDEETFMTLSQFADDYHIYKDGNRVVDVSTVKVLPPTVTFNDIEFDTYVRIKCVNVGTNPSKILIALVGWK